MSKLISTVFLFCAVFSPFTNAETKKPLLKDDLGFVVIPLIIEGQIPKSVKLESTRSFGETYRAKDLKLGNNFTLIKLPAGEYKWTRISLFNDRYFRLDHHNFKINVKPGVINYGGHFKFNINQRFSTAQYNYMNRSSVVLDKLRKEYPDLYNNFELVFAGHSIDPFIAYYERLLEQKESK